MRRATPSTTAPARRRRTPWLLGPACAAALLAAPGGPAAAAGPSSPPAPAQSLSGVPSAMWQTDGTVDAMVVSRGVLYVGGRFTHVRPPGAAPGTREVARAHLAAFHVGSGTLVRSFDVPVDRRVQDLAVSADGRRLYVVGSFTTVGGRPRLRAAAVRIPEGRVGTWRADADGNVSAVGTRAGTVYVGGDFHHVGGVTRTRLAALDARTGAVDRRFHAALDRRALALTYAARGHRLLVGGSFRTVRGHTTGGMAALDADTGARRTWRANGAQPVNRRCSGRVTDIVTRAGTAYVGAEADPPGCFEGTYAARVRDGRMRWNSPCLGAVQALAIVRGVLYKASHQHGCVFTAGGSLGGFPGGGILQEFTRTHLQVQSLRTGAFGHWTPDTNGTGPAPVGPHAVATDGRRLFVGGDFSRVEGAAQQGLTRFAPGSGATPLRPARPHVRSVARGTVLVSWPATWDADTGRLTYRLYRDGRARPAHTVRATSWPWTRPTMAFRDSGLRPGSTHRYRLSVGDVDHRTPRSRASSATVRRHDPGSWSATVRRLGATLHWRLGGDTRTQGDATGGGPRARLVGDAEPGTAGALGSNRAVRLRGDGYVTATRKVSLPRSYTESLWFRTRSVTGGSLLAVTDRRTGVGRRTDRALTLDPNGGVSFSVHEPFLGWNGVRPTRAQGPVFNDGRWHLAVAVRDRARERSVLYVDGVRLASVQTPARRPLARGFVRVGWTDLSHEQAYFGIDYDHRPWPLTEHLDGRVDEVAVFPRALSGTQVRRLWAAGASRAR